jgi:predicted RNA-binding protein
LHQFTITEKIKQLDIQDIKENLFHYSYDSKSLKSLVKSNTSKEDISYISAYSSFKGEVYENIVYELLLQYAQEQDEITRFVLKGPYQDKENLYIKSGLLIDRSSQIVYKSAYKDISEFDALFFTKDSLYFVEMSTSKKTSSLNKRLAKKYALLKMIFPTLNINALIVVTKGSVGLKNFPSYATIWLTNDLEDEELIEKIIFAKKVKNDVQTLKAPKNNKFIEALKVKYKKFQYFPTLEWILNKSRENPKFPVDLKFFSSAKLGLYFDIFTKLYIGYITTEEFLTFYEKFDLKIKSDRIIVTIEKVNQTQLDIVYYAKETNGKLKRIRLEENNISVKDKELDGFTNAEVRFFMKVLEEKHHLSVDNVKHILNNMSLIK